MLPVNSPGGSMSNGLPLQMFERGLLKQEGETDGEQHLAQRIEPQRPQKHPLHRQTEDRDAYRRDRDGQDPGAGRPDHRQSHVAAEQKIRAVRQIDDAHDAEDQRQPATDEKQQRAVRNAVEGLDQPELRTHVPCPSLRPRLDNLPNFASSG